MTVTTDARATRSDPPDRASRTTALFERIGEADPLERRRLLDEVVTLNLPVADALASRYARRGVPADDLVQVARLALVRVARTFCPDRESDFLAYAVPSIRGAIKRYFRDVGWTVRPPRRVQEAQLRMNAARSDLVQRLGREPTVDEMAFAVELDVETVIEALVVDSCYSPDSLDRPLDSADAGAASVVSSIGWDEPGYALSEQLTDLAPAIRSLCERDRRVLHLRFVEGMTQSEVGREIGVSQMQVSRILARILHRLRDAMEAEPLSKRA